MADRPNVGQPFYLYHLSWLLKSGSTIWDMMDDVDMYYIWYRGQNLQSVIVLIDVW